MTTIAERCLSLIANQKALSVETLRPDQTLEELQFDSLDKVTLVFDIEEEFHLSISDAELAQLHTLGDIINGVTRKATEAA